ncbi:helix-turn-helix domain-containing protein [Shimia ponticola]|uniref:helix-turn-helix domain-containing protein n=1 Tax=Shimia ponticola TaxID=2582893 RepID=UPI0011BD5736|nr:XRE family transcriptional regulator [Shimia ponticola]
MTRPDILDRLATRLKEARAAQGLSLEAVAQLSGVSRSMVSQIERGESSPTVATLWNLTQALKVDFAGLLQADANAPQINVTRSGDVPTIAGRGTGCTIRILSAPEQAGVHEVYELQFEAGGVLDSDPHQPGTRETLAVIDGAVSVVSGEAEDTLQEGDTARYAADVPHRISARDGGRAFLIVHGE